MATYAELAADLLKDAATFYKSMAGQSPAIAKDMNDNVVIYERMANAVRAQPNAATPSGHTYAMLAAKLLNDTAKFYRKLAAKNPPVKDHFEHTANIYDDVAKGLTINPLATI